MKEKITEEAKRLFYDEGYNKTACSRIAEACGLSQGGLFYHFQTKNDIGNAVYSSYMINLKNIIAKKFYEQYMTYDLQLGTAIETMYEIKMLSEDQNARRFYCEFFKSNIANLYKTNIIEFYKLHEKKYDLHLDNENDELKMIAIETHVASVGLNLAYFDGEINTSLDFLVNAAIRIPYELMKIPSEKVEDIITNTQRVAKELDLKIKPYFEVE